MGIITLQIFLNDACTCACMWVYMHMHLCLVFINSLKLESLIVVSHLMWVQGTEYGSFAKDSMYS